MKSIVVLAFILFSGGLAGNAQFTGKITPDDLKTWTYFLASDDMKGRKNGSPEMKQAAEYIAALFRESGLKPAVGDTSFFQEYSIKGRNNITVSERNVLGILEGTDPVLKNEWILISAHFDHIGIGTPVNGDSIFNGADDNATGTATVMALARLLSRLENRPKRSILFAAWSGEEMGMRGSRWFLEHPLIPMDQMKLNLNFEMTGEFKTLGDSLYILTGNQFSDIGKIIGEYNKTAGWKIAQTMLSTPFVFLMSDNAAFAIKRSGDKTELNLPAFTMVTTDDMNIIHKTTDEPQFVDYISMASFVNYTAGLITWLSGDTLEIHWDRAAFEAFLKK